MKGQAKVLIPALIGIAILLLTGISGIALKPGEQATHTASRSVDPDKGRNEMLGAAFRSSADKAVLQTSAEVAADLAIDLSRAPGNVVAKADMD